MNYELYQKRLLVDTSLQHYRQNLVCLFTGERKKKLQAQKTGGTNKTVTEANLF